jgi:predicted nucleic acid-binding Zn ribbon protein
MRKGMKMKEHEMTHCVYCDKPLPAKGWWKDFCNSKCAWKDGERWERDRRSDMARYYEV